jgi:lysophospholipase L1-like esterase
VRVGAERKIKVLWPWVAFALALVLLAALRLPATAPADAQPLLGVNVSRGHVDVAMIAPKGSQVTFFEEVAGVRQEIGKGAAVPPKAGGPDGLAAIPALPWRCDRTVRRFVGEARTPDGRLITAANEARTPDCRDRISLRAPTRVERGERVPITLKDRWQLGDLRVRLCVSRTGARRRCSRLTFAPGEKTLSLSRDAGGRVALLDLDLIVAGIHRHHKIGVGRKAPAASRPVALVTGDSMMQGIDSILTEKLKSKYRVIGQTRPGSGVSKPLDTPWTKFAANQAGKYRPVVTVVLLGGNDGYKMSTPAGQEVECCGEPWRAEYAERLKEMATSYSRDGLGTVVWALLPPPKRSDLAEQMSAVNDAIRRMAAAVPGVRLVHLDRMFGPEYREEIDGRKVRDPDGLHFSLAGQRMAAQAILEALRKAAPAPAS